ncbi:MAG: efflux RND transporter periplasmic adaptor subunit [Deltaproteobacteria bacterium]|nr:efflux RND transporter periplasmic adaptor subunit [Deltaproteobacteria bacterium]
MKPAENPSDRMRAHLESLRIERTARPTSRKPKRGRRSLLLVALVVVAIAAVAAWRLSARAPEVSVAYATKAALAGGAPLLSGSGYVVTGERYVSVGVRVPGRIEKYFIEEGQHVRKDDPLIQLDDRDYQAAVRSAEAALEVARANHYLADAELRRSEGLRRAAVVSDQELDVRRNQAAVARSTVAQAEAQLEQARVNLEYTTLRSPTDGVVLAKLKEVGEIAVPGGFAGSGDLVRLANLTDMRAEVDVNEADLSRVRLGGPARVTPDAFPDVQYEARVVKLYPQVDRQKGTLKVEVQIAKPDERLLPDMSARITFLSEDKSAGETTEADVPVVVPEGALRRDDAESFVWVVEEGRVRRVAVETDGKTETGFRVKSGLRGGEAVVTGDVTLSDGDAVAIGEPR